MNKDNTPAELDVVANTYFRRCFEGRDEDYWAWEDVYEWCREDLRKGWQITLRLLDVASSKKALSHVAAGPIEDLVNSHGLAAVNKIEEECKTNKRLLYTLTRAYPRHLTRIRGRESKIFWSNTKQGLKSFAGS